MNLGGRHGAALRSEVVQALGERGLREALASGVLEQVFRGVLIHAADSLKLSTRAYAALLAVDEPAVLSDATALALHGISSVDGLPVHITVPYSSAVRSKSGLVVHHQHYEPSDVTEIEDLRVFELDLSLAEFLCGKDSRTAFACMDEALHGLSQEQAQELRQAVLVRLNGRRDKRGIHRARMLVNLATGKADSPPESILRLIVVEGGFPVPEAQFEIQTIDGRPLYRLDIAWPALRIGLEYDGFAAHEERAECDERRDARMSGRGWIMIRASAADLRDPARVLAELRQAFDRRSGTANLRTRRANTRAGGANTRAGGAKT